MAENTLDIDERYFEIMASNQKAVLTRHRVSGCFDLWINGAWSRCFVDPANGFKSAPSEQQAWAEYMKVITT